MADKYTPGPLEAVSNMVRTSMATGGFLVAEFRDAHGQPHSDEAKANAVAFTALPELLALAEAIIDSHKFYERVGGACQFEGCDMIYASNLEEHAELARAALSKARGEQV
jgi:hypothetical protein